MTVIDCSTESELRDAIGSDRVIQLHGVIHLKRELVIKDCHRFHLIGPGSLCRRRLLVRDCSHAGIQNIRFRLGDEAGGVDCLTVLDCSHVSVDRCSFAWSVDELMSFTMTKNGYCEHCEITNSLMGYPLHDSVHHKEKGTHGLGPLLNGQWLRFSNNFVAHCEYRPSVSGLVRLDNNVFYNFSHAEYYPITVFSGRVDVMSNVFAKGPSTQVLRGTHAKLGCMVYESGTMFTDRTADHVAGGGSIVEWPLTGCVEPELVDTVGVFPRDGVDRQLENDWHTGSGKIIDKPDDLPGGWALVEKS